MFGTTLKIYRIALNFSIKEVAQRVAIDPSLLSRIERNERQATEIQVREIAVILNADAANLLALWLQDKVEGLLKNYPSLAENVLKAMETRVEYLTGPKALERFPVSEELQIQLENIDGLRAAWLAKKPADGIQLTKLNEAFGVEYTFESNRIEGNTLTLQETYLVIHQGLTISGKSLQEHLEAINHDEAIEFVMDLIKNNTEITEYRIKQLHQLILKGIDRKNAGVYRSVPVRIGGSEHIPPEPYMIGKLMEELLIFYEAEKHSMHPVLLAAEMHERLVTIHPFIDGNGRTSRLLMNLILLRHGYTVAILKGRNASRLEYYSALASVQSDANTAPFYALIANSVAQSLQAHLALV